MGTIIAHTITVNKTVRKRGPTLNHAQQLVLCVEMTSEEIYVSLHSIGDNKAPGVDGYNTKFLKKAR